MWSKQKSQNRAASAVAAASVDFSQLGAPRIANWLARRVGLPVASACALSLLVAGMAVAQIVPDGGTKTTVTTLRGGQSNVLIAPATVDGISRNTYTEFSVVPAGVNLDNRSFAARTILNEVTSSRISNLNGPIEVLGARAHVIIANPNGIRVDGATFTNTGGVALSTGKASLVTRQIASSLSQQNIVLHTGSGPIDVTGAGLSGAMTSLQLIADRIRVDGPIENSSANVRADLRLLAGGSQVEYDSTIMPGSELEEWGRVVAVPGRATGNAIEITARGSLKANTVRVQATNKGAGVSHAGQGLASLGDFSIDASGKVSISGSIKASRHINVRAGSIEAYSRADAPQSTVQAVNGALILLASAGDISNTGVLMSGKSRRTQQGVLYPGLDSKSQGGVTLKAAGDIRLLTESADQLAIVFAADDDLVATAGGDIINNTGRLLSNATTRLSAAGDLVNAIDVVAGETPIGEWTHAVTEGKRLWYTLWQSRGRTETITVDYGDPRVTGQQAYIVGGNVVINAGGAVVNHGGSINANGNDTLTGTLSIDAATILSDGVTVGGLYFTKSCGLTCVVNGGSDISIVGGGINAASWIKLAASKSIGATGQLTAFGDLTLTAPEVALQGIRIAEVYASARSLQLLAGVICLDRLFRSRRCADCAGWFHNNNGVQAGHR